ncbi:MAG: tetratricopeptide repeat protein, partial [candidate division Zixibacteria bacterium]|nr:tetratricopeptide repeat protein [candidate division Zixibacteria bacterium]
LNPTGAHETNRPDVASVKSGKITQITDKNSESDKTGSSGHNKSTRTSGGSKKTKWASIALTVNIDGARLSLDGDVIGAGNLKYTKLKPGKHNYLVEARGFQPASGTIELTAGKTRRLQIILPPINQQMQLTSLAEDLLESGTSHLKGGDFQKAIDDFTEAINHQPGFAEAHMSRAQAYTWVPTPNLAYDDFIRAAEIYRAENNPNRAITAYNNALEIDRESLKAHLGRADQFLLNGEEIAAIVDYESALEIDKKNSQAHLGLGMARFQQANFRRAIRHFEDARSLDSKDPLAHQYLMLSYLAADDIENMKESFKEFQEVASEAELTRFQNDQEFSSVMEIINNE